MVRYREGPVGLASLAPAVNHICLSRRAFNAETTMMPPLHGIVRFQEGLVGLASAPAPAPAPAGTVLCGNTEPQFHMVLLSEGRIAAIYRILCPWDTTSSGMGDSGLSSSVASAPPTSGSNGKEPDPVISGYIIVTEGQHVSFSSKIYPKGELYDSNSLGTLVIEFDVSPMLRSAAASLHSNRDGQLCWISTVCIKLLPVDVVSEARPVFHFLQSQGFNDYITCPFLSPEIQMKGAFDDITSTFFRPISFGDDFTSMKRDNLGITYELLGEGGQGLVRKALCRLNLKHYAVKSSRCSVSLIQEPCEIHNLSIIHHKNVIGLCCAWKEDVEFKDGVMTSIFYMATECCPRSLLDYLNSDNDAKEREVIFDQAVSAISYMHSKFMLHRDLKPANILLQGNTVKICDFGNSCVKGSADEEVVTKGICGTKFYSAPELNKEGVSKGKHKEAADVYSLGIVYYELHSGITNAEVRIQKVKKLSQRVRFSDGWKGEKQDKVWVKNLSHGWTGNYERLKRMITLDPTHRST